MRNRRKPPSQSVPFLFIFFLFFSCVTVAVCLDRGSELLYVASELRKSLCGKRDALQSFRNYEFDFFTFLRIIDAVLTGAYWLCLHSVVDERCSELNRITYRLIAFLPLECVLLFKFYEFYRPFE